MRHAEVTKSPCKRGADREECIRRTQAGRLHVGLSHAEIARKSFGVFNDSSRAAGLNRAENKNDDKSRGHDDALDEVRRGCRKESAHRRVEHDDEGADQHGCVIVEPEQRVEKLSAGGKTGCGIRHEKHNNEHRCECCDQIPVITIALREEFRQSDRIRFLGVPAEPLGDNQPVEICSGGKTDAGPGDIGKSRQIGKSGKAHQQVA